MSVYLYWKERIREAANESELAYIIERMADDERITNAEYTELYGAALDRAGKM